MEDAIVLESLCGRVWTSTPVVCGIYLIAAILTHLRIHITVQVAIPCNMKFPLKWQIIANTHTDFEWQEFVKPR